MKKNYALAFIASFLFLTSNAQWVKTNGPEGIYVTSFLKNDTVLLCGTYAQGVFRSPDNGSSWAVSNIGLENKWVECLAKDSTYLYAGTFGQGVYRSSDNGHTWTPANTGIQTQAISCLLSAAGYLFAGTVSYGVFRSADHGNSWVDINDGALNSSYIHSMVYNAPRFTVEADNYLFYSFTQGGNWDIDQGSTAFYVIKDFFQHGDTLLATTGNTLFRSTDGGVNWGSPNFLSHIIIGFDNINDTIYAGTFDGIYSSTDFGQTWAFTSSNDLRHGAAPYAFAISGNNFLLGYDEIGVYKSQDMGVTWQQTPLNDFEVASNIDDAMIFDNGIVYTGTHYDGVYKTSDQGNTWTKIGTTNNIDTLSNEIIFDMLHVGANIVLAGGCGTGLFRSADNGNTWTHITNGLPPDAPNFTCIKTLAQCGPNILCAMVNGVFYSVDSGLTWLPTNLTPTDVLQTGGFAVRGNIACVGVIGDPPFPTGVYRSTNYGITWSLADPILDIETMATGGGQTMYAGELFTAYVSHDDGLTWNGLGVGGAFTILAWDNYVFIGNETGVLYSDNYGASFIYVNQGMDPYPNNAVQGLTRDSTYIYAGTYRDGVWRRPLSDFGFVTGTSPIPDNHNSGFNVFPSVTSADCSITYSVPGNSEVVIELTDYTGKLIKTVVNENKPAGSFAVTFNTGNLDAGVYLLNLKIDGSFKSARKLIVSK